MSSIFFTATIASFLFCGYQVDLSNGFEGPPVRPLATEKLIPLGNSGVWLCEEERQLRKDLASLPAMRQSTEGLQKELDVIVMANARLWANGNSVGNTAVEPEKIGDVPVVRRQVIRLTNVRIQLAMTLSRIRRASSQMVTAYERLANDQSVQAALAELADDQRLGPASEYNLELQRLRDYFPFAETPWVPVYLQGANLRFTGICSEHAPATFTWNADLTHVLLTTGSFQAAGLQLPKQAKPIRFRTMGSNISVHSFRLPYLQFGNCMLREVPIYVLPLEFEYLGNRIGRRSFRGYQVKPEPARLRVSFESEE